MYIIQCNQSIIICYKYLVFLRTKIDNIRKNENVDII